MWNLSALADKAKEAAARIERQLDDSVGLKDDAPGGAASAVASASTSPAAHDDLLNDDDDFFSDDHHDVSVPEVLPEASRGNAEGPGVEAAPAATRLDATADDGGDFFGDEGPGKLQAVSDQTISENGDEEVDFGDDGGGADGWDDVDEIPLDDDNEEDPVLIQRVRRVEQKISINTPEPGPVNGDANLTEEVPGAQKSDASPDVIKNDIGSHHELSNVVGETKSSEDRIESLQTNQSNDDEAGNIAMLDHGSSVDAMKEDKITPPEIGYDNQLQHDGLPAQTESISEPVPRTMASPQVDDAEKQQFLATISELESQLYQREQQLASKSDQIASLSLQHESETAQLRQVISETKEEAKKRIIRAKERVEEMQTKLTDAVRRADAAGGSSQEQSDVIAALRAEGEQLARKQSQMEQSVRTARGEARELEEKLDIEKAAREKEAAKVDALEKEVKSLKEDLTSARKGESQSKKLEGDLVAAKEESEKQRASNLGLEQQLKELKEENKSLKKEVEDAREGAALELEGESNKLRKERDDMMGDLESKLRTSEREANVREDALRHEVSELRKRWQDAVRRAEDLSMDVQHSTAPLLRQLESTERQNRARAAAWAEIETKLRTDLEDHVIKLEKLTKEKNDLVASDRRSQRLLKDKDDDIASAQETIDALSTTIENLESKVEELEEEVKTIRQQLAAEERKAAEGASKVRNEMMKAVVDSEERYRSQVEALEQELNGERERRGNLEKQLDELAESVAAAEFAQDNGGGGRSTVKEKKLRSADNQASILHETLVGLDSDVDDDEDEEDGLDQGQGQGSFAAMEQLSQGLKGAKVELEALRKQLSSSEDTREALLEELGEARQAVEKLPLFEQKVSDLTMEVQLKDMEIRGLQDDIADVRFLYRTQLDALLEEKAATPSPSTHSGQDEKQLVVQIDDSSD
ncbi:hypothetical protein ACHAWF_006621 [Thalassiosira exigua]